MKFTRSKKEFFVDLRKYVIDLLKETSFLGCRVVETPIEPNIRGIILLT